MKNQNNDTYSLAQGNILGDKKKKINQTANSLNRLSFGGQFFYKNFSSKKII